MVKNGCIPVFRSPEWFHIQNCYLKESGHCLWPAETVNGPRAKTTTILREKGENPVLSGMRHLECLESNWYKVIQPQSPPPTF